jgi:WD40 repeat protein
MCRRFCFVAATCFLLAVGHAAFSQAPAPVKQRVDAHGDPLPDGAIGRLSSMRYRHGGKQLLGFAADGKTLLLHGSGAIHWMDVETGKIGKTVRCGEGSMIPGSARHVQGAALSGDRAVLAYADYQEDAFGIMNAVTGKELKCIKASDLLRDGESMDRTRFQLSHNGKGLLVVSDGRRYSFPLIWADTTTGQRLHTVEAPKDGSWSHAQWSHDGKQVVAAAMLLVAQNAYKARLYIFDAASAKELSSQDVGGVADAGRSFAFSLCKDGKTLLGWWTRDDVGGGKGEPVRLYDMTAEKQLREIRALGDISFGGSLVLSPDSKQAYIHNAGTITELDVDGAKQRREIDLGLLNDDSDRFGQTQYRPPPALSLDGKLLAMADAKVVAVYDLANSKPIGPTRVGTVAALVQFAPDGQTLAVGGGGSHWIWDVKNSKSLLKLAPPADDVRPSRGDFLTTLVGAIAFSSDGKLLAVVQTEGGVNVWDAASGKHLHQLTNGGGRVALNGCAFAPQGHQLAAGGEGNTVRLWDASTGKQVQHWTWQPMDGKGRTVADILCLAFSPDGKTLAASGFIRPASNSRETAMVLVLLMWETVTGCERLRLRTNLDFADGDPTSPYLIINQLPMSMTFSPDGKTLALASFAHLHLIDTFTGKDVRLFSTHSCIGKTATFSRDGKSLFLGRQDGGIRVLDAGTGRVVRDIAGHEEVVLSLALSPDGKTLASGSADGTVLMWDVNAISQPLPPAKPNVIGKQLEALWNALADADAAKAYQAMHQLASSPAAATLLQAKVTPIAPVKQQILDKLLADLDSKNFEVRDKAASELAKLGDLALDALQKRLAQKPTLEMRQRLDKLLAKLQGPVPPAMLQQIRAIESLEKMGTPEALAVLEALADGARGHRVTEDARAAAKRLKN